MHADAVAFSLILVRAAMTVSTVPMFAGRNVPQTVKAGLVVSLATMWYGRYGIDPASQFIAASANLHWTSLALGIVRETIIGAMLGVAFGLLMLPTRIAGAWIAQEMGLSMATITDPAQQETSSVLGKLFDAIGILVFFSLDVHHVLLRTLGRTFERWPVGDTIPWAALASFIDSLTSVHGRGILLIAPVAICLFATMISLLLLARAVPAMNLFSVGLGLRISVGLVSMLVFLPDIVGLTQALFARMAEDFVILIEL